MTANDSSAQQIELRIASLAELFNSMDPNPFGSAALDPNAVAYIESWAMGFAQGSNFRILIHLQDFPAVDPVPVAVAAIHNHFHHQAGLARRELGLFLRQGRVSLLIGLSFLALCLLGADLLDSFSSRPLWKILKESLIIAGWVGMWHPANLFLYEWWPLVRKRKVYDKLGQATVQVMAAKPA